MNWHLLKCESEYFEAIIAGVKTCECRINDRDYQLGDVLVLREYGALDSENPGVLVYSDRVAIVKVTHIVHTKGLLKPRDKAIMDVDWAVMSIVSWNENLAAPQQIPAFIPAFLATPSKPENV